MRRYSVAVSIALFLVAINAISAIATVFEDPNVKALHESVDSMRIKAEKGDPEGQTGLGMINLYGFSGTQDFAAAKDWFEKAAKQGYPEAMVQLGNIYESGLGVEKDATKAVGLYSKAAELNYPQARFRLGMLYFAGVGVVKNEVEGEKLLRSACDNGYRTSCGVLLWREAKIEEARAAFNLQCQAGDQMACGFQAQLPPSVAGVEVGQVEKRDKGGVGVYLVIGLILVGLLIYWLIRNDPGEDDEKGQ